MTDGWRPYALIVDMSFNDPVGQRSVRDWLVVKVHSIYSCEIGSVPAAVPNATEVARLIADRTARKFECGVDEPITVYRRAGDRTVLPDWVQNAVGELPDL